MKLATLKSDSRDGTLIVVNRDLTQAVRVPDIASTLQEALDNWTTVRPRLEEVYRLLMTGFIPNQFAFDPTACHAPLPRAYTFADGSSYLNHILLVRKARGVPPPENLMTDPLMYQGGSDCLLGPYDPILAASEDYGIDLEGEVAVITDDVPMGCTEDHAAKHIQLIMLCNDVSLRNLIPEELKKGFGFFHGKPPSSFSPVAVTPDELGSAWKDSRVHLPLESWINGKFFGNPDAGPEMHFSFARLISHAAKTRPLCAGSIIGSGTVSNQDRSRGFSCLAETRTVETLEQGKPQTPFLRFGDTVTIDMKLNGKSVCGKIEQKVQHYGAV